MKHKTIITILSALLDIRQKMFKLTLRYFTTSITQHFTNFCKENLLLTYLLTHFSFDVAPYPWAEPKIMFVCTSGAFLNLSLCSGPCLGTTCWDHRGPWTKTAQGRNEQDRTHKGSHSPRKGMTKHISRGPEGSWPTGKILFFSASFIQKRKRLKHQKHSDLVTTFLFLRSCIFISSVLD
jgi:hypothetical protein